MKASLERVEAAYEDLVWTRAFLGTMLAEAISKDRDLSEFGRQMQDLSLLIRSTDIRRTELKVELLGRRLQEAQEEHRRTTEGAKRAGATVEEVRRSYVQAVNVEQRSSLEAQRLEGLHREERPCTKSSFLIQDVGSCSSRSHNFSCPMGLFVQSREELRRLERLRSEAAERKEVAAS